MYPKKEQRQRQSKKPQTGENNTQTPKSTVPPAAETHIEVRQNDRNVIFPVTKCGHVLGVSGNITSIADSTEPGLSVLSARNDGMFSGHYFSAYEQEHAFKKHDLQSYIEKNIGCILSRASFESKFQAYQLTAEQAEQADGGEDEATLKAYSPYVLYVTDAESLLAAMMVDAFATVFGWDSKFKALTKAKMEKIESQGEMDPVAVLVPLSPRNTKVLYFGDSRQRPCGLLLHPDAASVIVRTLDILFSFTANASVETVEAIVAKNQKGSIKYVDYGSREIPQTSVDGSGHSGFPIDYTGIFDVSNTHTGDVRKTIASITAEDGSIDALTGKPVNASAKDVRWFKCTM